MLKETLKKLNAVSAETEKGLSGKWRVFTRFYGGNAEQRLADVLKALAPEGKVIILFTSKSYARFGREALAFITSIGCKPIEKVLEGDIPSVDDAGAVLSIAEEARCILAFDGELFGFASYSAMIAKMPCVFLLEKIGSEEVVSSVALLKNGNGIERVKVRVPRYVVVDEDAVKRYDVAEAYSGLISRLPDFADYRINCSIEKRAYDKRAYALFKEAVTSAFGIFSYGTEERCEKIAEYKFTAELANLASDGRLCDFSAMGNASYLFSAARKEGQKPMLSFFSRIMQLYELCFSGEYDGILEIPDYLSRADKLSSLTGCDDKVFLTGLKKQCDLLSEVKKTAEKTALGLYEEVKAQRAVCDKAISTYYALGGRVKQDCSFTDEIINLCGDLPASFNGMTLVRESGIAEYLKL